MNELEKWETSGVFKAISKKEASRLTKELARLQKLLGGIRDMKVLPDVVFVIDPVDTMGAVRESHVLGIPVVAVCDTNADPDLISLPIPGNDDAARSIKLFCGAIADSILEGRAEVEVVKEINAGNTVPAAENPAMAQAFEDAMLAAEKAEEEKPAEVVVEEVVVEEVPAVAEKAEEKEEKPAKKTAAKKPAAKKTTAKKTAEKVEEKPAKKVAAKKPAAKKTATKTTKKADKEEK